MKEIQTLPSGWYRAEVARTKTTSHVQVAVPHEVEDGGRYRIRTYDFHRVKMNGVLR
jgi:hypothetical protein